MKHRWNETENMKSFPVADELGLFKNQDSGLIFTCQRYSFTGGNLRLKLSVLFEEER